MGLFGKKKQSKLVELKCPAEGCTFTCDDPVTLKRHTDYKHPDMSKSSDKK